MAYHEVLAERVREALVDLPDVIEKKMFSGVCFMVDNKMCICVSHDELLCRVGPEMLEKALEKTGTRVMINNGRTSKSYVFVSERAVRSKAEFEYWIQHCLAFNKFTKASKSKKSK